MFSGVPNKFLENGTLTNHRGVTIEDTNDYVMPDTAPDDICDVSIKRCVVEDTPLPRSRILTRIQPVRKRHSGHRLLHGRPHQ